MPSFFETLSYRFRCLRWICDDFVQSSLVDVTAKLRQRICYDMEILVLRVGVPLCMEAEVSRSHVGSHVRHMERFYIWRSVASNPQFEVALEFAITDFCFLAMSLDCCIRSRSCSLLFGIPAWRNWSLALQQRLERLHCGADLLYSVTELSSDVLHRSVERSI